MLLLKHKYNWETMQNGDTWQHECRISFEKYCNLLNFSVYIQNWTYPDWDIHVLCCDLIWSVQMHID